MDLNQSLVLVTGASKGIGKGAALALAKKGAHVLLLARTEKDLNEVADEIQRQGGKSSILPINVTDPKEVEEVSRRIKKEFGVPDVLVHAAGQGRFLYTEETSAQEAIEMMSLPYFGAFFGTQAFLKEMIERKKGMIVLIGSPACLMPWPGATGYTATRFAIRGFYESLRLDLHGTGVKLSLVLPGKVKTNYFAANPRSEERIPMISRLIPTLSIEEIGETIAQTIKKEKAFVLTPFALRFLYTLTLLSPGFYRWIVLKTGWKRK